MGKRHCSRIILFDRRLLRTHISALSFANVRWSAVDGGVVIAWHVKRMLRTLLRLELFVQDRDLSLSRSSDKHLASFGPSAGVQRNIKLPSEVQGVCRPKLVHFPKGGHL